MISTKYFDKFISSQSVKDVIYRKNYVTQPKIEVRTFVFYNILNNNP